MNLPVISKRLPVGKIVQVSNVLSKVITVTLMNHQVEGTLWMKAMEESSLRGGGLADDMGLGKTLQTILLCVINGIDKTLIVCPSALTSNWIQEFSSKLNFPIPIGLYHGTNRRNMDLTEFPIVVTTYGTLIKEPVNGALFRTDWRRVVLDESQYIKNAETKASEAVCLLRSRYRWCLSGTPVQNKLEELYSFLRFLRVEGYSCEDHFRTHVLFGNDAPLIIERLFLRRLKEKVLRLPKKTIIDHACPMTKEELTLYRRLHAKVKQALFVVSAASKDQQEQQQQRSPNFTLVRLQRLRMACNDVFRIMETERQGVQHLSSKHQHVHDLVKTLVAQEGKVLVFSTFLHTLDVLSRSFSDKKIPNWVLSGTQNTKKKRDGIIRAFTQSKTPCVLLLQTMVGSVGLNLTQASAVVLVEPWWNPFVDDQASDRAYRIGQTRSVEVFKCYTPDTIEERIMGLQEQKRDLVKDIWNFDSTKYGLSRSDIEFLLG